MLYRDSIDTETPTPRESIQMFFVVACAEFTIAMVVYLIATSVFAHKGAQLELGICWSMVGVALAATTLQLLFFTPIFIKRMSYPVRLALFGVGLYVLIATVAVAMNWFPSESKDAWISFTISYLSIFIAGTAFAHYKMKKEYRVLNEKLAQYRSAAKSK